VVENRSGGPSEWWQIAVARNWSGAEHGVCRNRSGGKLELLGAVQLLGAGVGCKLEWCGVGVASCSGWVLEMAVCRN
jgi:hypothetical protein